MSFSYNHIRLRPTAILCCVTLMILAMQSQARDINDTYFDIDEATFYGANCQPLQPNTLDNEALFLSAAMELDVSMSHKLKRTNFAWLCNYRSNKYSGMHALRTLLRMSLKSYLPKRAYRIEGGNGTQVRLKESQFKDIDNYRLYVSDDSVKVRFRYRF